MAEELLERSARIIDTGALPEAPDQRTARALVNPMDASVHELADGVALVCGFSHVVAVATDEGLVLFDTSHERFAPAIRDSLRRWSGSRVDTVVYTHGHIDHVGGTSLFDAEADEAGVPRPRVVAHAGVPQRFRRYELTAGWNRTINARQFLGRDTGMWPATFRDPDVVFEDSVLLDVGGERFVLRHDRGETDDHAWAWFADRRMICAGDFFIWNFPNAGNPQKVQRYPVDWALALRAMASLGAELFVPAHGLPIAGADRIARVLDDTARALESLVHQTIDMMNDGASLDTIIHTVEVPADLADRPYLAPFYDEPEFVVRNIWRLYGGWWDGNPAHLKPAPEAALAAELAALAGGARRLADRALELAGAGDLRLACHLVELAGRAAPDDADVHGIRAEVYRLRRHAETSLMAKGIFTAAAVASERVAGSAGEGADRG